MARRPLTVVAVAVIVLAIAWFAGGRQLIFGSNRHSALSITADDDDDDDDVAGPARTREFAYDGSLPLTIDAPVTLHYTRGAASSITVEGPAAAVNALRFERGRLYLGGSQLRLEHALKAAIVAPQLPGVTLQGAGDLRLEALDQPALAIDLEGAGNVVGTGKVARLAVKTAGAGNVDLSGIQAEDAKVEADGIGNVDIAATGTVDVAIAGAGNVSLHAKPRTLASNISGVGHIGHDY